jgi:uncharacterized protein (TIGR00369 family)
MPLRRRVQELCVSPCTWPPTPDYGRMTEMLTRARQFIEAIPHARALGMVLTELGDGRATLTMPWDARLVGDPTTGVLHGGAISALMDTASGAAVMCHPAAPISTATLDLRIDYMRPASPGERVTARAECHHVTRSVAFVRVIATDADETRPVAMGTGAFTLDRPKGAAE